MNADLLFFFDGKPAALELYRHLEQQICTHFPDVSIRVQKTQISFISRHIFAMASLPRRKKLDYLIISFGLSRHLDSPRILAASEPWRNRWTHHVEIRKPEEADEELMAWLQEAHGLAVSK